MSNPLNNKEFRHFLNFVNGIGRVEISEPVKFDASEFVIEQDGYARDVSFQNEEIDLEFYKGQYEASETPQTLPNGVILNNLSHAFEWLIEDYKRTGFESEIEYILERNGVDFVLGNLNYEKATTDELTYLNCKVVQGQKRALAKRRESIKVDVFSDENLDEEYIEPLSTTNILLKAKPVVQESEWIVVDATTVGQKQNAINQLTTSGIDGDLTYMLINGTSGEDYKYIRAVDDLTGVTFTIKELNLYTTTGVSTLILGYKLGEESDFDSLPYVHITYWTGDSEGVVTVTDYTQEFTLPDIQRGHVLWLYFDTIDNPRRIYYTSGAFNITATSTAIDSVIKGVRYIDLIKQTLKSVNGFDLVAPKYDVGGEFYDQFAFNGNLIRNFADEPFTTTLKDRRDNLMELNADMQINSTNAIIGQYNDFYANVDNGGFLQVPSSKFLTRFNERYTINEITFSYKNYEKDRDEENTLDSVHTETQWSVPNKQVQNTKEIKIGDIRDPFLIESTRRQALKETTALDSDTKVFVLDVVPLSPSARGGFSSTLTHYVNDDGDLQLLNDATYNWNLLGLTINQEFELITTSNADTYTVTELTNNIITLTPTTITPTTLGEELTEVSFPYTNVAYTNRTDEGFDSIENVASGDKYSNLRYTIRRNMKHWESYFNTACKYTSGNIKNTYFLNNSELVTQFNGGDVITEGEAIPIDSLDEKILSPKIYESEVVAEYDNVLALIQKYQELETYGGFIRIQNNDGAIRKVYPQKLSYVWATKVLSIVGEERNESDFVEITSLGDNIFINEVGYDLDVLPEVFYQITGDFIVLYDENGINLINLTKFDRVKVNGVSFANTTDLAQAIIDL